MTIKWNKNHNDGIFLRHRFPWHCPVHLRNWSERVGYCATSKDCDQYAFLWFFYDCIFVGPIGCRPYSGFSVFQLWFPPITKATFWSAILPRRSEVDEMWWQQDGIGELVTERWWRRDGDGEMVMERWWWWDCDKVNWWDGGHRHGWHGHCGYGHGKNR